MASSPCLTAYGQRSDGQSGAEWAFLHLTVEEMDQLIRDAQD